VRLGDGDGDGDGDPGLEEECVRPGVWCIEGYDARLIGRTKDLDGSVFVVATILCGILDSVMPGGRLPLMTRAWWVMSRETLVMLAEKFEITLDRDIAPELYGQPIEIDEYAKGVALFVDSPKNHPHPRPKETRNMSELRNHTRWTASDIGASRLQANLLMSSIEIDAFPGAGYVDLHVRNGGVASLNPDEARMIGVRLIEGAALAAGDRAIRKAPSG
jgi:hypothetical protein